MTTSPPDPQPTEAGIYLVATPIGNMEDITLRALRVLRHATVLACEDTRVTRKVFQRHGIPAPKTILACNDHNEQTVAKRLLAYARDGAVVAFCSDAGMPGISDPGFTIVKTAQQSGVPVTVIPGVSAVTMAVTMSGMEASRFTFLGFPPRRDGRVRRLLEEHGRLRSAMVLYESPRRVARLLALAAEVLGGDREAAVCLELTKKYERFNRGPVGRLAAGFAGVETRGEAVVIIAGAGGEAGDDAEEEDFSDNA